MQHHHVTGGAAKKPAAKKPAAKKPAAKKPAAKKPAAKKADDHDMEYYKKMAKKHGVPLSKDGVKKTKTQLKSAVARKMKK
jgi:hypothetical protein